MGDSKEGRGMWRKILNRAIRYNPKLNSSSRSVPNLRGPWKHHSSDAAQKLLRYRGRSEREISDKQLPLIFRVDIRGPATYFILQ
ncbi:hypothetical protein Nepgr_001833 [Nepenthes gracilis]|uniref:Uncharacterized protein n=1 Tax=Nepenthes gracilis TaxID=150966 RepID=A0AAD3P8V2_NEPGR|nr:hypothetical protein Nepgr_001833 [Nepenthes gracilis]